MKDANLTSLIASIAIENEPAIVQRAAEILNGKWNDMIGTTVIMEVSKNKLDMPEYEHYYLKVECMVVGVNPLSMNHPIQARTPNGVIVTGRASRGGEFVDYYEERAKYKASLGIVEGHLAEIDDEEL